MLKRLNSVYELIQMLMFMLDAIALFIIVVLYFVVRLFA